MLPLWGLTWREGQQDKNCGCLAQILGYPVEYFSRQPQVAVEIDGVNFRAGRAATRSARDSAVAAGVTGIEVMQWVEDKFTLPSIVVPSFEGIAPGVAAQLLREEWGLGTKPLPNLVQLCESRGISVMVLPDAATQVDAFSLWYEGKPFIFIARQNTPERARFDIARELGHLVLHRFAPVDDSSAVQEREADEFASALLMPESLLAEYLPQNASVNDIVEAKYIFQVSAFALATSLHKAGRMTDWIYRKVCIELTRRGYRDGEPDGMGAFEQSRLFPHVFAADKGGAVTAERIAADLAVPVDDVLILTFSTRLRLVQGEGKVEKYGVSGRPALRVVR